MTMKYHFYTLTDRQLLGAIRIAKHRRAGLRPFFQNPKDMIALRQEAVRRKLIKSTERNLT
jgi:hypothetical protein